MKILPVKDNWTDTELVVPALGKASGTNHRNARLKVSHAHFLLSFFLLAPSVSGQVSTSALETCVPNRTSTVETILRWEGNARVMVYAKKNDFAPSELATIKRAIDNWNTALADMQVDIQFSFGGERETKANDLATVTINRGPTFQNHRHLAEIDMVLGNSGQLSTAAITLDPGVTDTDVMTSVLTHEFGHSLGMADCPKCRRGTTIMALYRGRNRGNDTVTPTHCDRLVVARAYQQSSATSGSPIPSTKELK